MAKYDYLISVKKEKLSNYEIKDIQELFDKYPQFSSVKEEYLKKATPGVGIKKPIGKMKGHSHEENKIKDWIFDKFGGKIKLLKAKDFKDIKTPDYCWNGTYWDLKTVSTEKAADSAIRKGLKQISEKPGGIILYYINDDVNIDKAIKNIAYRTLRSSTFNLDIMIIKNENLYDIIRYNKK